MEREQYTIRDVPPVETILALFCITNGNEENG